MNPQASQLVVLEEHEGYWQIVLNNPEKMNALTPEVVQLFRQYLAKIGRDTSRQVVIITGVGKAFCAGADIKAFNQMTPEQADTYVSEIRDTFLALGNLSKIFIAAVNGHAIGGGAELLINCDLAIASEEAKIGFPELKLGLLPSATGTVVLASIVGKQRAKELILRGELLEAQEAYRLGLVNHVVSADEVLSTCVHLVGEIQGKSQLAISRIKTIVNQSDGVLSPDLFKKEKDAFRECFASEGSLRLRQSFGKK